MIKTTNVKYKILQIIDANVTNNCYKSDKKLLQKWERQTNKQTKTKYRVKTKQSFCIKTKQTKHLIIIWY